MINCTVKIYRDDDTLDGGQRVAGAELSTELLGAPAYLSAPQRGWERAAAIEGILSGVLSVHTAVNLNSATRAELANHAMAGSWQVADVALSGFVWRLTLQRRP